MGSKITDAVGAALAQCFLALFVWFLFTEILNKIGLLPGKSK